MDPILIVDDEKDNLEALRRMLRGHYEVSIAESPFEGLRLVQTQLFHVIVSDQRMPEMTGVEFLEKAKKLSPLSTRILLTGYTDIDSVIDAINRGQIYRYVSKPWDPEDFKMTLRQANEAFLLKKELQEKNKSLEKALVELTVLDRAKSRFLSLISHELNTPLTIMNSFVELISERKKELPLDFAKAINSIQGASGRLGEIVREIVDYTRLESDTSLNKESADLIGIIELVNSEIRSKTKDKKIEILVKASKELKHLVDSQKLKIALLSLAQDTIKRAPMGTSIEWEVVNLESSILIELQRLGEPLTLEAFTILETGQSQMHHHQNLGVGLALCKTIIEKHAGEISVRKKGEKTAVSIQFKK